jgi:dolichyl-phosphate-mannose--protein O-mannosyl transferase
MWELQKRVGGTHPYMSAPWQWPLLIRPMWYAFDKEGLAGATVRGVFAIGNPWIMWTGFIAVLYTLYSYLKNRGFVALCILAFYFGTLLSWMIIPRKITFYYYYYPTAMVLSFALGYLFFQRPFSQQRLWLWGYALISVGVFIYFYPILAALRINTSNFIDWMWLKSWI